MSSIFHYLPLSSFFFLFLPFSSFFFLFFLNMRKLNYLPIELFLIDASIFGFFFAGGHKAPTLHWPILPEKRCKINDKQLAEERKRTYNRTIYQTIVCIIQKTGGFYLLLRIRECANKDCHDFQMMKTCLFDYPDNRDGKSINRTALNLDYSEERSIFAT